jgi:hypothetical protein
MHRIVLYVAVAMMLAFTMSWVFAEEVRIGHLETNDDIAINWLYVTCNTINSTQMRCNFLQTMIMKKKTQAEMDADIKTQAGIDPLTEFNQNFAGGCKGIIANETKMQEVMQSGVGVDGKPINQRVLLAGWPMMQAMIGVCKNPTHDNAAQFFKSMLDHDRHTCKVHNDYSQSNFTWDAQTNSWTTQEGPTGPCGTFVIGALTQDPKNHFWHYVEKHLRMNPKGQGVNGLSCQQLPEYAFNYTWQITPTKEGCEFIESLPD